MLGKTADFSVCAPSCSRELGPRSPRGPIPGAEPALTPQAQVRPRCGRLVAFSSGVENPHGVWAVTRGRRCTLALWHTWAPEHREQVRRSWSK